MIFAVRYHHLVPQWMQTASDAEKLLSPPQTSCRDSDCRFRAAKVLEVGPLGLDIGPEPKPQGVGRLWLWFTWCANAHIVCIIQGCCVFVLEGRGVPDARVSGVAGFRV